MKFFGFRGGVHPPENKIQTEHLPIEKLESPDEIFVPLLQHIGAPLNPLVNVGDRVLKGQKIADAEGLAVPVHSPVSGTVTKIESRAFPLSGKVMTIFIENYAHVYEVSTLVIFLNVFFLVFTYHVCH